ncbi:MAG: hypothetical protein LPK07_15825 [Hymenobacteraceae bacterium]|nr:hypothetical protein [Hymenobacteraceae bacterium]
MIKLKNGAWLTAVLMVLVSLYVDYTYFTKVGDLIILFIDGFVQVFMIATLAIALALFASVVPYRKLKYSHKFRLILPFTFIGVSFAKFLLLVKYTI